METTRRRLGSKSDFGGRMTHTTRVGSLDSTIQKTNEWLAELSELMGTDPETAYDALRGTLTTVRDLLAVEEAAQFAAEMPMLIRGVYFTGWSPSNAPERYHRQEFLAEISRRAGMGGDASDVADAARAVFTVLARRMSAGEVSDVLGQLPKDVQAVVRSDST
jgi:uncharacterized protein (DUF2267 family)